MVCFQAKLQMEIYKIDLINRNSYVHLCTLCITRICVHVHVNVYIHMYMTLIVSRFAMYVC